MHGRLARTALALLLTGPAALFLAQAGLAQTSTSPGRVMGTVAATGNGSVTIHPAAGPDEVVALDTQTRMLEAEPGAKTLAGAKPITAGDLAVGDRVLVRLSASGDAAHPTAAVLIAMKHTDIAQAHAQEQAEWRTNGVSGIASMVDPVSGTITLKTRPDAPGIILHTTSSTVFRQYAPASTAFSDTKPATIATIHAGDQVRARGPHDASGASVDAEEVVSGSFADIAGTVVKTDSSANTITLKDLATKKTVTLALASDTQLRRLPAAMATGLAAAARRHSAGSAHQTPAAAPEDHGMRPRRSETDMLEQAPTIALSELKKGDAVMVVASGPGAPKATAITIISGVEPLLEAPAEASEGLFSASWNLGGGGAADDSGPQR